MTEMGSSPRWYVANTRPHSEFRASAELANQGFEVFLPSHTKTVRHARQFRSVKAAFFPGYIFVALDLARDQWRKVNSTIGIARMIMAGAMPKPVPVGIVEELRALTNRLGEVDLEPRLKMGQPVKLLSGAFAGLIGQLIELDDSGRVRVLLEIMGNAVKVETRKDRLAPID